MVRFLEQYAYNFWTLKPFPEQFAIEWLFVGSAFALKVIFNHPNSSYNGDNNEMLIRIY